LEDQTGAQIYLGGEHVAQMIYYPQSRSQIDFLAHHRAQTRAQTDLGGGSVSWMIRRTQCMRHIDFPHIDRAQIGDPYRQRGQGETG
jgi:hypothetical protein